MSSEFKLSHHLATWELTSSFVSISFRCLPKIKSQVPTKTMKEGLYPGREENPPALALLILLSVLPGHSILFPRGCTSVASRGGGLRANCPQVEIHGWHVPLQHHRQNLHMPEKDDNHGLPTDMH